MKNYAFLAVGLESLEEAWEEGSPHDFEVGGLGVADLDALVQIGFSS
jgi:hypothetical protein